MDGSEQGRREQQASLERLIASQRQQLPSLAPRLGEAAAAEASSRGSTGGPTAAANKPLYARQRKVVAACETCRNRKSRCDGARPRCKTCKDHGRECVFFTQPDESRQAAIRRRQASSLQQLQQLQASHDALRDVLDSLVAEEDVDEIRRLLSQLRPGNHAASASKHLVPEPAITPSGSPASAITPSNTNHSHPDVTSLEATTASQGLAQPVAPLRQNRSNSSSLYEELCDMLVQKPLDDAVGIVQMLRDTRDVSTVLGQAKEADLLLQLRLMPETRRRYALPAGNDMPDFLLTVENPYLDSLFYETYFNTSSSTSTPSSTSPPTTSAARVVSPSSTLVHYYTPYGSAQLHEPILEAIKPSQWTTVLKDDRVLRRLLQSYFLYDYQNYPAFHKDLFLQDMKRRRDRFCSPLLVNAILAVAAHTDPGVPDSDKFWIPQGLGYRFLAEAKRLWELEDHEVTKLTTLQAAIMLNNVSFTDANEKIGNAFFGQSVAMAKNMKLLTTRDEDIPNEKMRKARTFTAWCLYGWDVALSYFFFKRPVFEEAPLCKLPGPNDLEWHGDCWVRYPNEPERLVPANTGAVFKATMELRLIQHKISLAFFEKPKTEPAPSSRQIEEFRYQLYSWFDALPESINPNKTVLPFQIRLHMEYYCAHITLAKVPSAPTQTAPSNSTSVPQARPPVLHCVMRDPVSQSLERLETLVRIYHIRHGINFYDSSMNYYFTFLGMCTIEALSAYYAATVSTAALSPEARQLLPSPTRLEAYRSALIMCAKSLHEQGKSSYVCQATYYILRGAMPTRERDMTLAHVKEYSAATSPGVTQSTEVARGSSDESSEDEEDSEEYGSKVADRKGKRKHGRRDGEDTVEARIAKYNKLQQFRMPVLSIAEESRGQTLQELAESQR